IATADASLVVREFMAERKSRTAICGCLQVHASMPAHCIRTQHSDVDGSCVDTDRPKRPAETEAPINGTNLRRRGARDGGRRLRGKIAEAKCPFSTQSGRRSCKHLTQNFTLCLPCGAHPWRAAGASSPAFKRGSYGRWNRHCHVRRALRLGLD